MCDAIDGTNGPPGSMGMLADLIPNPSTRNQFVCRPASVQATNFTGFNTPGIPNALLTLGNIVWGMVPSARNPGKDEPFCYNLNTGLFITISNVTSANSPTSPATTGDWTPPQINSITNGRIMITHPGYNFAGGYAVGWIDISSFQGSQAGNTHTTNQVTFASSVYPAGFQVGQAIAGGSSDIPANTYITAISADGKTVTMSNAATGTNAETIFVAGGTPSAPIYGAGQTSPVALVGQPVDVAQFNGRAYYAINNSVQYSDSLIPTQITNASQALILGDSNPITALAGTPLTSQVTGGIVQSLIAFKGDNLLYQITGDQATSNLVANSNPASVGTVAANSICQTPEGTAFVAPDGLRMLTLIGTVTEPMGAKGDGINVPFLYAVNPTRICAAYNQNVIRVTVQNGAANGQPTQEYWYDLSLKAWTGPHSFPAAVISTYQNEPDHGFVAAGTGIAGKLWVSTVTPTSNSTYTENGNPMMFTLQTSLQPDNQEGKMNQITQSRMGLNIPQSATFNITALNELGDILNQISLVNSSGSSTIWDAFTWGAANWGGTTSFFYQWGLPWTNPLVFKQVAFSVTGSSTASVVLGNLYLTYRVLGFAIGPPL